MTHHYAAAVVPAVLSIAVAFSTAPAVSQEPGDVSLFMRVKLKHSQEVVEGLATEDFEQIAKSAQEMSLLSKAAEWQVFQTPEYQQHSQEFQRAANALRDAAKEENIDGAALAYVDVTLKCVNCHKYVRSVRTASFENDDLRDAAQQLDAAAGETFHVAIAAGQDGELRDFMRLKLMYSQNVLEGVTVEDFEMVAENAAKMQDMGAAEQWLVYKTDKYRRLSDKFERMLELLGDAAEPLRDVYRSILRQIDNKVKV